MTMMMMMICVVFMFFCWASRQWPHRGQRVGCSCKKKHANGESHHDLPLTQRHTRSMWHSWKFLPGGSVQLLHAVELGAGMEPGMLANHQYMCEVTSWSPFLWYTYIPSLLHASVWTPKFVGISSRSYKIIQILHNLVSCLLCCLVLRHSCHSTFHCPISILTQKPFW